jgi:hypothetical protein
MMAKTLEKRLLARLVARELSQEEIKSVSGGILSDVDGKCLCTATQHGCDDWSLIDGF